MYKITIEKQVDSDEKYDKWDEIYTQKTDEINLIKIIDAVNFPKHNEK